MRLEREQKIAAVLARREPDVALVLDHLDDPHNVAAILRSCDAFGVSAVHLYYIRTPMPDMRALRSQAAASAAKWLDIRRWTSVDELSRHLRARYGQILLTDLQGAARAPQAVDLTHATAFVLGNEHQGVSTELRDLATGNVRIPMRGFVDSLNVSVAAAILLYEMTRQRHVERLI